MFVCLSFCLLVCGGQMEIQTQASILVKFCRRIETYPRRFCCSFDPCPLPQEGGPREILKAERNSIEKCLQNKRCSAGCSVCLW